jgi:uncharacterized membrane protein
MSKTKKFGWILFGLTTIINIVFFPFLPDSLAIQFNANGISRTVSKPLGLVIMPIIILIINLAYGNDESKKSSIILGGVILFAANLGISIVNLIIAK